MCLTLESAIFFLSGNQREVYKVDGSWTRLWRMGWISIGWDGSWEVENILGGEKLCTPRFRGRKVQGISEGLK